MSEFVIRFEEPSNGIVMYAGWTRDGSLGYAPTFDTAAVFETREVAVRTLMNSFGPSMREIASVVEFTEAVAAL